MTTSPQETAEYLRQLEAEAKAYAAAQPYERRPHDGPAIMWAVELAKQGHSLQVGTYQVSDLCCHVKYLSQWPVTTSEVAAAYLRRVKEGHDGTPFSYAPVATQSALFFTGPLRFHPDLAYVDITACYPSLFFPAGFDFHYAKGQGAVGEVPFRDWEHVITVKGLRNLLWGNFLSRHNTRAAHGELKVVYVPTTANYRPALAQYVFDTTHAIATWARERFDIRCWLTDAAVLPGDQAQDLVDALAEEWLLDARTKWRGPGTLFSLNSRRIGEHVTRVLAQHPEHVRIGHPIDRILPVPVDKLMGLRRRLAEGELPMPPKLDETSRAVCGACKQEHPTEETATHRRTCEVLVRARAERPSRERPERVHILIGAPTSSQAKLRTCANCKGKFRSNDPSRRPFRRPGANGWRERIVCPACDADWQQDAPSVLASWPVCRVCRARIDPAVPMVKCPSKTSRVDGPAHMCQDCASAAQAFDLSPLPQLHVAPAGIKTELQLCRLAPAAARNGLALHTYRRLPDWVWWWLVEVPDAR